MFNKHDGDQGCQALWALREEVNTLQRKWLESEEIPPHLLGDSPVSGKSSGMYEAVGKGAGKCVLPGILTYSNIVREDTAIKNIARPESAMNPHIIPAVRPSGGFRRPPESRWNLLGTHDRTALSVYSVNHLKKRVYYRLTIKND